MGRRLSLGSFGGEGKTGAGFRVQGSGLDGTTRDGFIGALVDRPVDACRESGAYRGIHGIRDTVTLTRPLGILSHRMGEGRGERSLSLMLRTPP